MQQKAGIATDINSAFSASVRVFNWSRMREGPKGIGPRYVGLIRKGLKDTAPQPELVMAARSVHQSCIMHEKRIHSERL